MPGLGRRSLSEANLTERPDTTAENLKAAAGEHLEWGTLYPDFAEVADKESFPEIAKAFRMISAPETGHEKRYLALLQDIEKCWVFKRDGAVKWRRRNYGYIHEGPEAPEECPAYTHPRAHYALLAQNYQTGVGGRRI